MKEKRNTHELNQSKEQNPKIKTLTVYRVSYGKSDVPIEEREYHLDGFNTPEGIYNESEHK